MLPGCSLHASMKSRAFTGTLGLLGAFLKGHAACSLGALDAARAAQIEVVSQALITVPVSDREPALTGVARRLTPKAALDDHQLLAALNWTEE
jgi:hypothetical protein